MAAALRIWIDLANTPHVLFFEPVIRALEGRGHVVTVTARRFAGTLPLAAARRLRVQAIGAGHDADRDPVQKQRQFEARTEALAEFAHVGFDVAASHASFTQAEAARRHGIPVFGALDYEHVQLSAFAAARRFMIPSVIPPAAFVARGVPAAAIRSYDGLKEHVYLAGFRPDPAVRARLGVDDRERLVTVRPIAPHPIYIAGDTGDALQQVLLERLAREPGVRVLLLARTETQARTLAPFAQRWPTIRLCDTPLDGPSLICASDLVICGGGTMLREAAVLGVPAVSIFPGVLGAVDRWLVEEGRARLVRSAAEAERLRVERRPPHPSPAVPGTALAQIVQGICDTAHAG